MKKIFWIMSLVVVSCSWGYAQNQDQYNDNTNDDTYSNDNSGYNEEQADNSGMSYQTFYDQLSPYGSWVNYPGYGYVWVPQANAGFSPYETDGQWEYTDMGWTWVSDYAWGWATFHYGSWIDDPAYGGWLWVPGYDWAPAWVTWGMYDGYYCWSPLGPRDYINGHWGYGPYDHHWNLVPQGHMGEPGIGRYVVHNEVVNHDRADFEKKVTIINHNSTYGHSVFNAGPRVEDVQKAVGHPITKLSISNSDKPEKTGVRGNTVNIYRPSISKAAPQQHAVPSKVVNPSEVQHNETPARGGNETPARGNNETPSRGNSSNGSQHVGTNENNAPARENTNTERPQPTHSSYTPPRQSTPEEEHNSGGGFIPNDRPASAPSYHSAPAPSFHSSPSMGGGSRGGGGGRH